MCVFVCTCVYRCKGFSPLLAGSVEKETGERRAVKEEKSGQSTCAFVKITIIIIFNGLHGSLLE